MNLAKASSMSLWIKSLLFCLFVLVHMSARAQYSWDWRDPVDTNKWGVSRPWVIQIRFAEGHSNQVCRCSVYRIAERVAFSLPVKYMANTNDHAIRVVHSRDANRVSTLSIEGLSPPEQHSTILPCNGRGAVHFLAVVCRPLRIGRPHYLAHPPPPDTPTRRFVRINGAVAPVDHFLARHFAA